MPKGLSTNFDAVLASTPLDATAATVAGSGGEYWTPAKTPPPGLQRWDAPPPLKPFQPGPGLEDFSGRKFGRFTVVGLLGEEGGRHRGNRWVVRCACGDYEARTPRTIRMALAGLTNPLVDLHRCFNCAQLEASKNAYRKKGAAPLSRFVGGVEPRPPRRRSPQAVLAEEIARQVGAEDHDDAKWLRAAESAIAGLNSNGYRIVRERMEEESR